MHNVSNEKDIYIEYAGVVKRFLISLSGNVDLAEDLTQETFYQAYKSIHRYNGKCKMSVWLCQIAKHIYFDYLKKEKHIQKIEIDKLDVFAEGKKQESIEEAFLVKEKVQELLFAVQNAKKSYGQVFWLRAYEEMSFKEIGEILGKSENWIRVNYYRAKEWIRRRTELDEDNL